MCHIVLADDHGLIRQGLKRIIETKVDYKVVGEASDGLQLLSILKKLYADLILLDISMPNLRGLEAIPEIKATHAAKIIVLTMHTEKEYLYQAFSAGADGYLLKDDPETELFAAIKKVRDGQTYVSPRLTGEFLNNWAQLRKGNGDVLKNHDQLSNREKQILKMIAEGKRSKEIADLLFISPRTVEHHRKNLMTKLNLKNTPTLIKYALNHGYV